MNIPAQSTHSRSDSADKNVKMRRIGRILSRSNQSISDRISSISHRLLAVAAALSLLLCVIAVAARVLVPRMPRASL